MDSPRGRVYQMVQVSNGAPITPSYEEHIGLCLACRGCESACPSGVPYGRMVEDARCQIEAQTKRGRAAALLHDFVFRKLLVSPRMLTAAGTLLYISEKIGLKGLMRVVLGGRLGEIAQLAPAAEPPFFFSQIGKTFPAEGEQRHRVAFLAGCIANVSFARLNEATVRVLQKNGCEVVIPDGQGCCGALHLHSGLREDAQQLARRNIDALEGGAYDAILTNAAGCGSTLKEYGELLADDTKYAAKAHAFAKQMRDVTEFLAGIELNREMKPVNAVVTYQDSCHLAHGQRVRSAPRKLLAAIPGRGVSRDARGGHLLRQRGHLQRVAERDVDADSGVEDEVGERYGCGHRGDGESRMPVADGGRGPHAWQGAEGDARGGTARSGVREARDDHD